MKGRGGGGERTGLMGGVGLIWERLRLEEEGGGEGEGGGDWKGDRGGGRLLEHRIGGSGRENDSSSELLDDELLGMERGALGSRGMGGTGDVSPNLIANLARRRAISCGRLMYPSSPSGSSCVRRSESDSLIRFGLRRAVLESSYRFDSNESILRIHRSRNCERME